MTKLKLILLSLLFFQISKAQTKDFNLSDYKLPNLARRTLDFKFGLTENFTSYNFPEETNVSYYNYTQYAGKRRNNSFNSNFELTYKRYLNKRNLQRNTLFALRNDIRMNSDKINYEPEENYKYKSNGNNFNPFLNYELINRNYFNGESFIETDVNLTFDVQNGKNKLESIGNDYRQTLNTKQKDHHINFELPLKIGKGRVEQVQDARHAVYLLDELSKIDKVKTNYNNKDIIKLSKFISELKNKRFFDSRIRRRYEYAALDSFFTANNYLVDSDIEYFSTLSDFWIYGGNPIRESGKRTSLVFLPSYNYDFYKEEEDEERIQSSSKYTGNEIEKNRLNIFSIIGGVEYVKEKPINLYWQNSISAYAYGGLFFGNLLNEYEDDTADKYDQDIDNPNVQLSYNQTFGFYPNSRTNFLFGYSGDFIQIFKNNDDEKLSFDAKGFRLALNASAYYYISPQLRIMGECTVFHYWQDSEEHNFIDFDNPDSSYALNGNFDSYSYPDSHYREKQFSSSFRVNLVYSFF